MCLWVADIVFLPKTAVCAGPQLTWAGIKDRDDGEIGRCEDPWRVVYQYASIVVLYVSPECVDSVVANSNGKEIITAMC